FAVGQTVSVAIGGEIADEHALGRLLRYQWIEVETRNLQHVLDPVADAVPIGVRLERIRPEQTLLVVGEPVAVRIGIDLPLPEDRVWVVDEELPSTEQRANGGEVEPR